MKAEEIIIIFKPGTAGSSLDPQRRREKIVLTEKADDLIISDNGYVNYFDEKRKFHCINQDIIEEIIVKYEETK